MKRFAKIFLCLLLLLSIGFKKTEALETVQNITIDDSGIVMWDEVPGAAFYYVGIGPASRETKYTQVNMDDMLKDAGAASGAYQVYIAAYDKNEGFIGQGVSQESYYYESWGTLTGPSDPVWKDNYIASWKPSPDGDYYLINIYKDGLLLDTTYSFECEIDLSDYTSGAHQSFYFSVWSHSYGYEDSESVRSDDVYGKDPALLRLSGKTRYETCIEVSELLRNYLYGNGLFPAVVVTTGKNYPDALSGSYLAIEKGAALLLINESSADMIVDYINHYLMDDGMIYVLGGDGAVKTEWLKNLDHRFYTTILSGSDRYSTNIAILKAADVWGGTYLVCTGKGYADSLSCSAIDLPILLVGKTLNDSQLSYLDFIKEEDNSFYIIGGEGAVSEEVEKELEDYGTVVKRIAGKDRYETSVMIAREFFDSPHKLVLATGANFPDGLSGGPLANVLEAPLVLTKDKKENMARYYVYGVSIIHGYILGGTGAISDELADRVFNIGE